MPCTGEGCTKGACIAGIVLQQSWPWWPCDEHGIDLQHSIACSGVVMAPQSNAYPVRATASTATTIGFARFIHNQRSRVPDFRQVLPQILFVIPPAPEQSSEHTRVPAPKLYS